MNIDELTYEALFMMQSLCWTESDSITSTLFYMALAPSNKLGSQYSIRVILSNPLNIHINNILSHLAIISVFQKKSGCTSAEMPSILELAEYLLYI